MDALRPFATSVNYVNDLGQLDQAGVRGAYGPAKYDRLVALKRTWDPANVFRRNQNIRP
jgi:FAD/FMN-containing dehydrogenase